MTSCMCDYVKPTIRNEKVDHIIIHSGTNDLNSDKTAVQICNEIISLSASIREQNIKVSISGIVPRNDEWNDKAILVNKYLANISKSTGFMFIPHENIRPDIHLNASKLHLNQKGNSIFMSNFKRYIETLN